MYFIVLVTTQQKKKRISYYFRMLLKTAFNLISLNFNKKISLKKNIKKLMQSYNVIFFNKMHMYFKNFDILKKHKTMWYNYHFEDNNEWRKW